MKIALTTPRLIKTALSTTLGLGGLLLGGMAFTPQLPVIAQTAPTITYGTNLGSFGLAGRNNEGREFSFTCPSLPSDQNPGGIWGTDVYTTDSDMCSAAIHAGIINRGTGGEITVVVVPGQEFYIGSDRNGVESRNYRSYTSSFSFVSDAPAAPEPDASSEVEPSSTDESASTDVEPTEISEAESSNTDSPDEVAQAPEDSPEPSAPSTPTEPATPISYRSNLGSFGLANEENIGRIFPFECPPAAENDTGGTWGTNFYTSDSDICTAAVHAGLIELGTGGVVNAMVADGQDFYIGSDANDIASRNYRSYGISLTFEGLEPPEPVIRWNSTLGNFGRANEEFMDVADTTFICPPGDSENPQGIWGTNFYTSDSSICTAAVHAGVIDWDGGEVTPILTGGQNYYVGRDLNGIASRNYRSQNSSLTFEGLSSPGNTIMWRTTLGAFGLAEEENIGQEFEFRCTGGAAINDAGGVWGTDMYTADSGICGAAVHAGVITFAEGGLVTAVVSPGQEFYVGSDRNGIESRNYRAYGLSLSFAEGDGSEAEGEPVEDVEAAAPEAEPDAVQASNTVPEEPLVEVVPTAEELQTAIADRGSISVYGIQFEFDSAELLPASQETLAAVSELMYLEPELDLQIVGHTDDQGTMEYNLDLSRRRAESVVNALVDLYGVEEDRLEPAGASYLLPVADNDTEEGRALNRRVELAER